MPATKACCLKAASGNASLRACTAGLRPTLVACTLCPAPSRNWSAQTLPAQPRDSQPPRPQAGAILTSWPPPSSSHTVGRHPIGGASFPALEKRVFVGTGAVNRRHRHIQHAQIYGELPTMMIEMIHHHRADEADAWQGHQRLAVFLQGPGGLELRIVHFLQRLYRAGRAFVKGFQKLLTALGLRHSEISNLPNVLAGHLCDLLLAARNVQGELAQGERLSMRLPTKLILGNPLQYPPGGFCFLLYLHQNCINNRHCSSLSWDARNCSEIHPERMLRRSVHVSTFTRPGQVKDRSYGRRTEPCG